MAVTEVWPFVGRGEELRLVTSALLGAGSAGPEPGGVVIAGAAGVGKSRLLSEALDGLAETRCTVRHVMATAATTTIPFGALAHLLPAELPAAGGLPGVLRHGASALTAGPVPLVLAVDDAHLLDDVSAALLQHLVQARAATVALTVRSGEPAPDGIVALWKDELLPRVELSTLSAAQVDEVLTARLGARCDGTTVRRLHRDTAGNPLLLRVLVQAGLDSGALTPTAGMWAWNGPWVLAPDLVALISQRIGRLDADEQDVLEAAAFGDPIGLDLLASLVPGSALDRLVGKNLLWLQQSGRRTQVHLAHPLYGEVLRSRCTAATTNRWRRTLADAVESTGARRRGDVLRVATWRLDAGVSCPPDVLLTAARQAYAALDLRLAARLAGAAAEAGDRVGAAHVLWRAVGIGDPGRASDVERLQTELLSDTGLPDAERARLAYERAFLTFYFLERTEDAVAGLREVASVAGDRAARRELQALDGLLTLFTFDLGGSAAALRPLVSEPQRRERSGTQAVIGLGVGLVCAGRVEDAIPLLAEGVEALSASPQWKDEIPGLDLAAEIFEGYALLLAGRLRDGARTLQALPQRAADQDWHWNRVLLAAACAQADRMLGTIGSALRQLRDGEVLYRQNPGAGAAFAHVLLAELAVTSALNGDHLAARAALDEADQVARPSQRIFRCWLELARPWVAFAEGDRQAAVELAERAAEYLRTEGAFGFEQLALYDLVRLGAAERAVDRLAELTGIVQGRLVTVLAAHARAAACRDGAALDRVAGALAEMGANLFAAEAAVQAVAAHQQAGAHSARRRSARHAARLARMCHGARLDGPAALDLPALTPRERSVAELAAGGMTTAEIAERLVLSARTVDNHLHRVYAKLGVGGRRELEGRL